ncbi:hypothetical protein CEXT_722991 [Caerostris extrusa]|uniref:Uncharacterized protein n=1 Tax=Caerostris extrusa TaxID=172846 RepID=A0AAV4VDF2_CAEEX|nr:hypothetical protein CEXT_722991 [Caerostris extrusa]
MIWLECHDFWKNPSVNQVIDLLSFAMPCHAGIRIFAGPCSAALQRIRRSILVLRAGLLEIVTTAALQTVHMDVGLFPPKLIKRHDDRGLNRTFIHLLSIKTGFQEIKTPQVSHSNGCYSFPQLQKEKVLKFPTKRFPIKERTKDFPSIRPVGGGAGSGFRREGFHRGC